MSTSVEDRVANRVLQKCSQAIVDHINVDEVTLRLHSKSRLTLQEYDRLEGISTTQEKKKQFYRVVLADKGSAAYKDILEVLNDTANYKPHAELVDKLKKCHKCLWRRMTQAGPPDEQPQTEEASTASIKTGVARKRQQLAQKAYLIVMMVQMLMRVSYQIFFALKQLHKPASHVK